MLKLGKADEEYLETLSVFTIFYISKIISEYTQGAPTPQSIV
jgi:hypothetical protein